MYRSSSVFTTGESTCSMYTPCSEDLSSNEKSDDFVKTRDLTQMTSGPLSGSLLPSSASEADSNHNDNDSDAIYYFGYGPIVNPLVRYRRGCMIPPQNIRTAILYDHRLKFVKGGTANIVKSRGWDVKGVLLRFENQQEWEAFRHYDSNYDVKDISVSLIDKTNLDPKKKNDQTAPFEECDEEYEHEYEQENDLGLNGRSGGLMPGQRIHQSCVVNPGSTSLNNLQDEYSSEEEDYSCPFSFEPKSAKIDPNAVKCKTFFIKDSTHGERHVINENASFRSNRSNSVVGKPQERYLKLMTDGLRIHDIDETYIRDEILAVTYIPNERDRVVDHNYRSFPHAKKVAKISQIKYETKLCKRSSPRVKDESTHFVIGSKIVRLDGPSDLQNPCIRWLRARGHGKGDMTLLVHKTFIDKDVYHIDPVDTPDAITEEHQRWAEHVVLLYLERGGLRATVIGELTDSKPTLSKVWCKLKGGTGGGTCAAAAAATSAEPSSESIPAAAVPGKTKRFGSALGRMKKSSKNSKG